MKKSRLNKRTQKRNNISKNKIVLLIIIAALFTIGISQIAYFFYSVRGAEVIEARVQVSNKIGFAIGTSGMDFGLVRPGGSVTREVGLVNQDKRDIRARVVMKGDIAEFLDTAERDFILKENETKQMSFSVIIPEDTPYGNYTGKIIIVFERP